MEKSGYQVFISMAFVLREFNAMYRLHFMFVPLALVRWLIYLTESPVYLVLLF